MRMVTSYSVRLRLVSACLKDTLVKYREAVNWFIGVIDAEWDDYAGCTNNQMAIRVSEMLCIRTARNNAPKYSFTDSFYKFPSYLRRAAIMEAFGLVSSYRSNVTNWESLPSADRKKRPSIPKAGFVCPAMYRDNCFIRTGTYTARIKVWIRNTWDWLDVSLRKCDVDYILRRCSGRKECVPTLRRRGKVWSLDFSFEEHIAFSRPSDIENQRILSVDLGLNSACVFHYDFGRHGRRQALPASAFRIRPSAALHWTHQTRTTVRRKTNAWTLGKGTGRKR